MKLVNFDNPVMSSWFGLNGCRLDSKPYLSDSMEAKAQLARLAVQKSILMELTLGGLNGIINAGRIARNWVNDPEYGIPFLSSTDILQADLSNLSLISK